MNTDQIIVRAATESDRDTLLLFEQGVIAAERPMDPTLKSGSILYYDMDQLLHADHIYMAVAVCNGELLGSGYCRIESSKPYLNHSQYGYLGFMYVLPEHRGKGINALVVDSLKAWSKSKNITELRLEVYQQNGNAIHAYTKAGFEHHMLEMRMGI